MDTIEEQINKTKASLDKANAAMNNLKKIDPCEGCEMKDKSTCCCADIVMHDICIDCGEHCDIACDDCDWRVW